MTAGSLMLGPDSSGHLLRIEGDRVRAFESQSTDAPDGIRLDCGDCELQPGWVNAHTHIYSALAPFGMPAPSPPPSNFVQILERVWWKLDRALDADSLRASARLYAAEALLAGTTTLIDHHESPDFIEGSLDVLADACEEIGIRALLCFGATERNGGRQEAWRGLAECRRFIEGNQRPLVRGVVGLHASFTVSDETLREAARLCSELGTILHIHLAEDGADVVDAKERGYPGPLERLLEFNALPSGSITAHGVHLSEAQVEKLVEAGVWIVQNPRSNRGNRVGYPKAIRVSSRVALGTDGYPAHLPDEQAVLSEEVAEHDDDELAAAGRCAAGRRLAGERFDCSFSPLAPGMAADVVAVRSDGSVRHVLVGGEVVVRDGVLQTAEIERLRADAQQAAPSLWERMNTLEQKRHD